MENNTEYRVRPNFLQIGKPYYIEDKDGDGQWVIVKKIINSDFQDKVICATTGTDLVFSCKDILDGTVKIIRDDIMIYDEHDKHHFVRIINREEKKNGKED